MSSQSGRGQSVDKFYEELISIWGGSPATETLGFGVSSLPYQSHEVGEKRPPEKECQKIKRGRGLQY